MCPPFNLASINLLLSNQRLLQVERSGVKELIKSPLRGTFVFRSVIRDFFLCVKKHLKNLNAVTMVDWTDAERSAIAGLWGKIDVGEIGPQAMAR